MLTVLLLLFSVSSVRFHYFNINVFSRFCCMRIPPHSTELRAGACQDQNVGSISSPFHITKGMICFFYSLMS